MKLNREQYVAAHHMDGPMLVLAGPGSGKTHLLVERIRLMIEENHIPPDNILVITFSKKAARQMQARFQKSVEGRSYPVTFGTFHAVFYHILQEYDPNIKRLISEEEQAGFVGTLMDKCGIFDEDTESLEVMGMISSYRNLSEAFFARDDRGKYLDEYEREEFLKLVEGYESLCRREGVLDFDDMILLCRSILVKHEMFLKKLQNRYRYFLVDEFQDINPGQYDVLRLLAGDRMNVFAVGDDDQSIYAFRGSRPDLMKRFISQYRGCRQVTLTMNYRCSENVIGCADTLIRNNADRFERMMQRHLPSKAGGNVIIVSATSTALQAEFVCDKIEELTGGNEYEERDIAVLYRSGHCAKRFVKRARERSIRIRDGHEKEGINVMTAHASKGLEFKCVFIIGLQEGLFPHKRSMEENIEEERRLMYVAMTRAVERLWLCTVATPHGKRPSRFAIEAMKREEYITDCQRLIRLS